MNDTVLLDSDVASFLFRNSPFAEPFRPLIRGKRFRLGLYLRGRTLPVDAEAEMGVAEDRRIGTGPPHLSDPPLRPQHGLVVGDGSSRLVKTPEGPSRRPMPGSPPPRCATTSTWRRTTSGTSKRSNCCADSNCFARKPPKKPHDLQGMQAPWPSSRDLDRGHSQHRAHRDQRMRATAAKPSQRPMR